VLWDAGCYGMLVMGYWVVWDAGCYGILGVMETAAKAKSFERVVCPFMKRKNQQLRHLKINLHKINKKVLQKIHKTVENVNFVVGEPTLISVCKQIKPNDHRQPTLQLMVIQVAEGVT